ncbi:DivIVA domain-containing protein [Kribbella sp. NPDC004875]|uniref:DivIVA domain-containing protein n=1 Tax=Kribbella sp. NPDC004875 TaxID=3364107 RepID=UPI00368D1F16
MLKPAFTVRRIGRRYDRGQVDALVERLMATVERRSTAPAVTVDDLRDAAFSTPLFGAGYLVDEVDAFLMDAERWLPDRPLAAPAPVVGEQFARTAPRFTTVRLREGYDMTEVDGFVDRVMATVNGLPVERPVTAQEIRRVQFSPVRLSEGYDVEQVDAFLDTAEGWLSGSR